MFDVNSEDLNFVTCCFVHRINNYMYNSSLSCGYSTVPRVWTCYVDWNWHCKLNVYADLVQCYCPGPTVNSDIRNAIFFIIFRSVIVVFDLRFTSFVYLSSQLATFYNSVPISALNGQGRSMTVVIVIYILFMYIMSLVWVM